LMRIAKTPMTEKEYKVTIIATVGSHPFHVSRA
jgi:hypothetical protein